MSVAGGQCVVLSAVSGLLFYLKLIFEESLFLFYSILPIPYPRRPPATAAQCCLCLLSVLLSCWTEKEERSEIRR